MRHGMVIGAVAVIGYVILTCLVTAAARHCDCTLTGL